MGVVVDRSGSEFDGDHVAYGDGVGSGEVEADHCIMSLAADRAC